MNDIRMVEVIRTVLISWIIASAVAFASHINNPNLSMSILFGTFVFLSCAFFIIRFALLGTVTE